LPETSPLLPRPPCRGRPRIHPNPPPGLAPPQPVIARLEDADYQGHSLTMLQRIAAALNQRLDIRFKPAAADAGR